MKAITLLVFALLIVGCDEITTIPNPPPTVWPPVINAFTADATRLSSAVLDTFLRWDVSGTADTRCRIDTPGQPGQSLGNVPLGGFIQVRPLVSREYTLTCSNGAGTVIRMLFIFVG